MYIFQIFTILLNDIIGFIKTERKRERERERERDRERASFYNIRVLLTSQVACVGWGIMGENL